MDVTINDLQLRSLTCMEIDSISELDRSSLSL